MATPSVSPRRSTTVALTVGIKICGAGGNILHGVVGAALCRSFVAEFAYSLPAEDQSNNPDGGPRDHSFLPLEQLRMQLPTGGPVLFR